MNLATLGQIFDVPNTPPNSAVVVVLPRGGGNNARRAANEDNKRDLTIKDKKTCFAFGSDAGKMGDGEDVRNGAMPTVRSLPALSSAWFTKIKGLREQQLKKMKRMRVSLQFKNAKTVFVQKYNVSW